MRPRILLGILLAVGSAGQVPLPEERRPGRPEEPVRLPNGKMQSEEILKADYQKTLDDADQLVKLSEEVKAELDKNTAHVLSLGALKKLDEIDKLTKRMRNRMKR